MTHNLRAAALMVIGMTLFTLNDAVIKHLSTDYGIGQLVFLRGLLVSAGFALAIRANGARLVSAASFERWSLTRALCELGATFCFLSGIALLPLATATSLIFAAPLLLTLLAAWLLGERVRRARWLAVIAGFAGVLLITRPGADAGAGGAALYPLAAALFTALRDIAVRRVPPGLSSLQVSFATAWVVTLGGLALSLPGGWNAPSAAAAGWIGLSAALLCGAYFFYVLATRLGELSFVAPFKYVSIVLAMAVGYLVWGDTPDSAMLAGAAVVVASGLAILLEERRRRG